MALYGSDQGAIKAVHTLAPRMSPAVKQKLAMSWRRVAIWLRRTLSSYFSAAATCCEMQHSDKVLLPSFSALAGKDGRSTLSLCYTYWLLTAAPVSVQTRQFSPFFASFERVDNGLAMEHSRDIATDASSIALFRVVPRSFSRETQRLRR